MKSLRTVSEYKSNEHSSPTGVVSLLSISMPWLDDSNDSEIILDSDTDSRAANALSARLLDNAYASFAGRVAMTLEVTTSKNVAQDAAKDASPWARTWRALHCLNAPTVLKPGVGDNALASPMAEPKEHHDEVDIPSSGGFACKNEAMFQLLALLLPLLLPTADKNPLSHEDVDEEAATSVDTRTFQHSMGPESYKSSTNLIPP
mmetsp:Transcript_20339/g.44195  ORF Transcript_20339/g.44195 Transcript_20339/m.44195 type:complete len:204 (-) Transcript_20339:2368-2979(-)